MEILAFLFQDIFFQDSIFTALITYIILEKTKTRLTQNKFRAALPYHILTLILSSEKPLSARLVINLIVHWEENKTRFVCVWIILCGKIKAFGAFSAHQELL